MTSMMNNQTEMQHELVLELEVYGLYRDYVIYLRDNNNTMFSSIPGSLCYSYTRNLGPLYWQLFSLGLGSRAPSPLCWPEVFYLAVGNKMGHLTFYPGISLPLVYQSVLKSEKVPFKTLNLNCALSLKPKDLRNQTRSGLQRLGP